MGCAGSYCFEGHDRSVSNAYVWIVEPYDWFAEPYEIQVSKLVEAVNVIKTKPYVGTSFTKYRIVDGFYNRTIIDWTNV